MQEGMLEALNGQIKLLEDQKSDLEKKIEEAPDNEIKNIKKQIKEINSKIADLNIKISKLHSEPFGTPDIVGPMR